jgi:hypothetical protein
MTESEGIQPTKEQEHMSAKNPVLWISLFVIPLFAGPSLTRAQTVGNADVVTAIPNLENDAVKADLAGDCLRAPLRGAVTQRL